MAEQPTTDYGRALRYQLDDESWITTLLFMAIAIIVPLVGGIVAFGYQATVIEALARGGAGAGPPRFDLERLVEYLLRGLRMFVVSLIVTVIMLPVVWLGSFVLLAGVLGTSHAMGPSEAATTMVGCVMTGIFVVLILVVGLGIQVLITPLLLRAALDKDFGAIFDLAWARDFLTRTGMDSVKVHLFVIVISLGFFLLGVIACIVGIFPAIAYVMLVQGHLYGQLYLLYLRRGGRAIALP
ncbi:MAG TPA: DUF4013 domain-containing protein [Thermoanaerobaculia bacterium]|nr:DUF4013 domain-containing protein [Thermoanaerobaculia bacterium]